MSTLEQHIKSAPKKPLQAWADDFGVSRPTLYGLMDGTRQPDAETAMRIERVTKGAVPASSWPKFAPLFEGATRSGDAA